MLLLWSSIVFCLNKSPFFYYIKCFLLSICQNFKLGALMVCNFSSTEIMGRKERKKGKLSERGKKHQQHEKKKLASGTSW